MTYGKKIVKWIVFGTPTVLCVFGVRALFTTLSGMDEKLAQEIATAKRLGIPTEAVDVAEPPVPDAENAAQVYRKIMELRNGDLKAQFGRFTTALLAMKSDDDIAAPKSSFAELGRIDALLHVLPSRPKCWFNRDWTQGKDLLLPEYDTMKKCTAYLAFKADLLSRHGDWGGALKEIELAERIGRDVEADKDIIALLVQVSCQEIVRKELRLMIDRHSSNPKTLAAMQKFLLHWNKLPDLRPALGYEVVNMQETLKHARSLPLFSDTSGDSMQETLINYPSVRSFMRVRNLHYWCQVWEQLPADRTDYKGYVHAFQQVTSDYKDHSTLASYYDAILMPEMDKVPESIVLLQAKIRLLLTSISLLQRRITTKQLPDQLPNNLGDISIDPFVNRPLHYRREDHGFVLYSVGADLRDDGGHVYKKDDKTFHQRRDEVVEFH